MRKRTIVLTALLAGCLVVGCQGKEAKDNTAKDKAKTEIGNEKKKIPNLRMIRKRKQKRIMPVRNR